MLLEINTLDDVKLFVNILVNEENLNFHPDDDFSDYINIETSKATYNIEEASLRNQLLARCFDICEHNGADIYDLISEPLHYKIKSGRASDT
jgi:hypothetical protein